MEAILKTSEDYHSLVRELIGSIGLACLVASLAFIVYFDDIQITVSVAQDIPTIFNVRIFGIKVLDAMSISLALLTTLYLLMKETVVVTSFHKGIGLMFLAYCYAAVVGFVYSFWYHYDLTIWLQDFQQTVYMAGFFCIIFYLVDTNKKWKIFAICFLLFLVAKNFLIFYNTIAGTGKSIGDWAFRASQNSEFSYFPMMFFPILLLAIKGKGFWWRGSLATIIFIYIFNSLVGIYRTVWVMLLLSMPYLLYHLDKTSRRKTIIYGMLVVTAVLGIVAVMYPRFLMLAWNFKFASIFDWSMEGDRSNATRRLEIINVIHRIFSQFAFIQGMGLGAWWDDSARRLLPDYGSGFLHKSRYVSTHMWYLTQWLKLGLIGMAVYWSALYKMFRKTALYVKTMEWARWEKSVMIGLHVGLLCAFISSADFVRLFLFVGINLGLTASYMFINGEKGPS